MRKSKEKDKGKGGWRRQWEEGRAVGKADGKRQELKIDGEIIHWQNDRETKKAWYKDKFMQLEYGTAGVCKN